jgi:hypothetical protein
MKRYRCNLKGKRGIEELDHDGYFAIIANRTLYDQGKASKFTVVNTKQGWLDNVYPNFSGAISEMDKIASRQGNF